MFVMRKLKLQIQITLDGFVAGPNGELDWMAPDSDPSFKTQVSDPADSCDTILMGRKMTPGFIKYWENVVDNEPESPEQALAQKMVNMRKVVFSRTLTTVNGRNVEVENGNVGSTVKRMKEEEGKDMIVYGGAAFVSSLIGLDLIDEYYIFINPIGIGNGLSIFNHQKRLKLVESIAMGNGVVCNKYIPERK